MDLVEDVLHDVHAFRRDVVKTNGEVTAAIGTLIERQMVILVNIISYNGHIIKIVQRNRYVDLIDINPSQA